MKIHSALTTVSQLNKQFNKAKARCIYRLVQSLSLVFRGSTGLAVPVHRSHVVFHAYTTVVIPCVAYVSHSIMSSNDSGSLQTQCTDIV